MIGIAFSIGFVFGPTIGAMFSLAAKDSSLFYVLPALFALVLAVSDVLLVKLCLEETLPPHKRVGPHFTLILLAKRVSTQFLVVPQSTVLSSTSVHSS